MLDEIQFYCLICMLHYKTTLIIVKNQLRRIFRDLDFMRYNLIHHHVHFQLLKVIFQINYLWCLV